MDDIDFWNCIVTECLNNTEIFSPVIMFHAHQNSRHICIES